MKVFLLCSLNDEDYRRPCFEFFKSLSEAHQSVIDYIANDIKDDKYGADREIKYVMDISFPKNRRMRIDYSYGNEHFLVFEVFEIQVSDGDFLCIFHHAYDGVGFCIEKIGTFEECRNQMLDSAAQTANDFDIDITNDDVFEVNEDDSCVDTGEEWHMCNVVQFNLNDIQDEQDKQKYDENVYRDMEEICSPIYPNPVHTKTEKITDDFIKEVDKMESHEVFKELCEYHGVTPGLVEYLYESVYGRPKEKTKGCYIE